MKAEIKIKTTLVVTAFSLFFSSVSLGDCSKAEPPILPDAAVATEEEMTMAHSQVKQYIERNNKYVSCVRSSKKRNRTYREMKKLAALFNNNLKAYKARIDNNKEIIGERTALAMK